MLKILLLCNDPVTLALMRASADALTKPLALNRQRGLRLLRRHRAHALRLTSAGRAWATFEAATPHLRLSA